MKKLLLLLVLPLLLVLASCGGVNDGPTPTPNVTDTPTQIDTPAPTKAEQSEEDDAKPYHESVISYTQMLAENGMTDWEVATTGSIAADRYGAVSIYGHTHSEGRIAYVGDERCEAESSVLQVSFVYDRPEILNGDALISISPRVEALDGFSDYRLVYKADDYSCMGWFLYNAKKDDYISNPATASPICSAQMTLDYGIEYTVYIRVKNTKSGVSFRVFLDDPRVKNDHKFELMSGVDISEDAMKGECEAAFAISSKALTCAAPVLRITEILAYPEDVLSEMQNRYDEKHNTVADGYDNGEGAGYLMQKGIIDGGAYVGDSEITAQDFVAALTRVLADRKTVFENSDKDIMEAAKACKVIAKDADFDGVLTRYGAAKILAFALSDEAVTGADRYEAYLSDATSIPAEDKESVLFALASGAMTAVDGVFDGDKAVTWNDASQMLLAVHGKYNRAENTEGRSLRVPSFFANGMVLQRGKELPFWGYGANGTQVTVAMGGKTATADVENGEWKLYLPAMEAGGPYEIRITDTAGGSKTISDVLVGEVWIMAGQSNMPMHLNETIGGREEAASADYPEIRIMDKWGGLAHAPSFDVQGASWKKVNTSGAYTAIGYYVAKAIHTELDVPVGIIQVAIGGTEIRTWMPNSAKHLLEAEIEQYGGYIPAAMDPTLYYNGTVAPLCDYAVAGIVWYQGEGNSNIYHTRQYEWQLKALMEGWRDQLGNEKLPFYIIQLPSYGVNMHISESSGIWDVFWPYTREAQLKTWQATENTGLVVTIDAGDEDDIHPKNKRPVGERTAALILADTYGLDIAYQGPIYKSAVFENGKAVLSFDYVYGGLVGKNNGVDDGATELVGFEICGEDGNFAKAKAYIDGDTVVVYRDDIAEPVAVRYAWNNVPEFSLYNSEGFPATPFRTDEQRP
ncbi:MAG: sialate O-acetylesterase [Ruminococcaceae bacterium]|nr:sialate O-acetylesterase [Oscillospiraceae bacterium]